MVFSKHLYMVILSYILLIIAVAGAGIALIITHTALILGCLFLIISLFFIRALVKQLNKFMGHRTKRFFQWSGKMGERF